jgi:CDP-diacylglycerol--glycerol-3-phosphate 3-phosphatidyltransferase
MDVACTIAIGVVLALLSVAYGIRVAALGRAVHARVEAEGKSALVPKSMMEMLYWFAEPLVTGLMKLRVSPDEVTYASLSLGVVAGVLFASGHFGIGAAIAIVGSIGDALDGLLARRLGASSVSGEVLDSAIDRYVDFALIAGLAFHFRDQPATLVVALLALLGSFMVSYSTAKADELDVVPPRGSMRRGERCVLILGAATLAPVTELLRPRGAELPLELALGAIAIFANVSAIRRIGSIRAAVRARRAISKKKAAAAARTLSAAPPQPSSLPQDSLSGSARRVERAAE